MCWLCTYQGEPLGARLSLFIIRHIGIMDMACIAQQVSDFLLTQNPQAVAADRDTVHAHIARHMLHPRVRIAVLLRQLLDFSCILQGNMVINDNGVATIEKVALTGLGMWTKADASAQGNAELYLKVIAQITTLYKADIAGMLFAEDETPSSTASIPSTTAAASGKGTHDRA